MADYYTCFSAEITDLTDTEMAWLVHQTRDDLLERASEAESLLAVSKMGLALGMHCQSTGACYFGNFDLKRDERSLHLYATAGEGGDVEAVGILMWAFLTKFRPCQEWTMQYANVCSRPRLDGFGGGAIRVTTQGVDWLSSHEWLSERSTAVTPARNPRQDDPGKPHEVDVCYEVTVKLCVNLAFDEDRPEDMDPASLRLALADNFLGHSIIADPLRDELAVGLEFTEIDRTPLGDQHG